MAEPLLAPDLDVLEWLNSEPLKLEDLRGKVVLIEAFQMLCPACVTHALPQVKRVHEQFRSDELAVIGVHTVFEHHEAMTPVALRAFLSEFRYRFPVAVDRPAPQGNIPITMARYDLQGTPSQILIDRRGRIRSRTFGVVDDLSLGARLGRLLGETGVD
ncbi:MAG: redoxin domain-containing protein [Acidimicrobiales bacterium]|nr:redoxin domain-containing protein [Acidimicrobiales bacterium]